MMFWTHKAGRVSACFLMILAMVELAVGQQGSREYTLADWMSVTRVRTFVWSPDGTYLYYTSNAGDSGTDEIFRIPTEGGPPEQLSRNPKGVRPEPKRDIVVSPDGKNIFYTSSHYFQNIVNIFKMPAAGGLGSALTFNDAVIEAWPRVSSDSKTLAYFTRTGRGTKIFLLDLESQQAWPRLFDPTPKTERNPVWSPDSKKLAFFREGDTWIGSLEGGDAHPLIVGEYAGNIGSPQWSPDGTRIAFTDAKSGFRQVGVVDLATGQVTPITYEPHEHGDTVWSPDGKWLAFTRNDGMSRHIVVSSSDGKDGFRVLTQGKGIRRSPQFSPDGGLIAYIESTGNRTADIWMIPALGGLPRQATHSMGNVDPSDLSVPEEVTYPGPDNLPIPALLYKPKGFDPDCKYPVIVRIHGHPGQWNHSMNMMWQYLIQKGFVLIAINPRGSVGFGQGFHDLHVGDYGGTEYEDSMAILKYLGKLPYVDMTRKATWGGSGGGFLSLVIATRSPTVFQAQVIRAPVSSWKWLALERWASPARFATQTREPQRARSEFGGAYTEIPERYYERSPLNFVENVITPQLLMQGLRDSSVPPNESKRWVQRMLELGKSDLIEYIEYPDEDHSLSRYRSTVRDMLVRIDAFLRTHLQLGSQNRVESCSAP